MKKKKDLTSKEEMKDGGAHEGTTEHGSNKDNQTVLQENSQVPSATVTREQPISLLPATQVTELLIQNTSANDQNASHILQEQTVNSNSFSNLQSTFPKAQLNQSSVANAPILSSQTQVGTKVSLAEIGQNIPGTFTPPPESYQAAVPVMQVHVSTSLQNAQPMPVPAPAQPETNPQVSIVQTLVRPPFIQSSQANL